jgi:hypothetical protein
MARTALTELQQQIEAIRREAFAAGYDAAMQAVRELASRSAPTGTGATAAVPTRRRRRRRRTRAQAAAATAAPQNGRRRRTRARSTTRSRATATRARAATRVGSRRAGGRRPQRGANAQMIGEILRAASPRAIPPADIRRALQQKGVELAFTSIRHALGQLQQRNAAQPVGNTNTWRYRGS